MNIASLTPQQLRDAADLQEKIQGLQNELNAVLGGTDRPTPVTTEAPAAPEPAAEPKNGRRKRKMTAAWRKALSLAREARLVKLGLKAAAKAAPPVGKPKVERSPAWRRAKSKAMKAFWAARRAAGKTTL